MCNNKSLIQIEDLGRSNILNICTIVKILNQKPNTKRGTDLGMLVVPFGSNIPPITSIQIDKYER